MKNWILFFALAMVSAILELDILVRLSPKHLLEQCIWTMVRDAPIPVVQRTPCDVSSVGVGGYQLISFKAKKHISSPFPHYDRLLSSRLQSKEYCKTGNTSQAMSCNGGHWRTGTWSRGRCSRTSRVGSAVKGR